MQNVRIAPNLLSLNQYARIACIAVLVIFSEAIQAQDFSQYYSEPALELPSGPVYNGPVFSDAVSNGQGQFESPSAHQPTFEFEAPRSIPTSKLRTIDGAFTQLSPREQAIADRRYKCYRVGESATSFMPGDGDQFGWLDFENNPYLSESQSSGITLGSGLHLLSGPTSIALPPRLWDFMMGYQMRDSIGQSASYDLAYSLGVYSDFEDSAREGVRSLGHAVGSIHRSDAWDWVIGVDYLNRDDYKILPVMGFSWHQPAGPGWRCDLVFPRPRIQYSISDTSRLYLAGLMGGGTWDIEMPHDINDVMTYKDYRILFGHEQLTPGGHVAGTEIGLVLNRQVQMRHSVQHVEFDDAFVFRILARR